MKTNAKRVAIGLTFCKGQASHTAQRDAQTAQRVATGAALGAVGGRLGGVFSRPLPTGRSTAIGATGGALAGGADGASQAAQAWEHAGWDGMRPLGHPVGESAEPFTPHSRPAHHAPVTRRFQGY